jgi:hypothetical protein
MRLATAQFASMTATVTAGKLDATQAHIGLQRRDAPAAPATRDVWYINQQGDNTPVQRPNNYMISGDSTFELTGMTWENWGADTTVGTGTGRLNNCDPHCADGAWVQAPIRVTMSAPVDACGRLYYSRVHVSWTQGTPLPSLPAGYDWPAPGTSTAPQC